jgi:hypothetical protein
MTTKPNKPIQTLRDGNLKAAIWSNQGEKGGFYNVTFSRTWIDAEGKFHDSDTFSRADLLRLAHVATHAYDLIGCMLKGQESDTADGGAQ